MPTLLETLWNEPRAPGASPPTRADAVLVAALVCAAVLEGLLRDVLVWRSASIVLSVALAAALPWRRVHPLGIAALGFGATALVDSVAMLRGVEWQGLDTSAFLLLLPYALLRWGSGREVLPGLGVIGLAYAVALGAATTAPDEMIGGALVLCLSAALGASVRYRESARHQAAERMRLQEREGLARELHDTVAHHVCAIAVQAQAGRVSAATRPDAPLEALRTIEEAASRTLAEMRHMVRALRADDAAVLAPVATLADLERLARDGTCSLPVDVTLHGALETLGPTLESTLYRLAREAVTNSDRHARGARGVEVSLHGEPRAVRLRVVDDGEPVRGDPAPGFGLRGMAERAALLGGTLTAGPGDVRGWRVEVMLPKPEAMSEDMPDRTSGYEP